MRLLVDRDIINALEPPSPIARGLPNPPDLSRTTRSQVQAASLNLTVGDIFMPGTGVNDLGGINNPRSDYELPQGHTAVIRTRETIHLSSFRAGIAFPPANQSLKGLLMTNPGHVDPGYSGHLHCTVINMAHRAFSLKRGDPIMRILLFEVSASASPDAPYFMRIGRQWDELAPSPITAELLDRLSVDFVDVERRSVAAAKNEINVAQIRATLIPVFIAIIAAVASYTTTYLTSTMSLKDDFNRLQNQFIEAKSGIENKGTIAQLQVELSDLKDRIGRLEREDQSPKQPNEGH